MQFALLDTKQAIAQRELYNINGDVIYHVGKSVL